MSTYAEAVEHGRAMRLLAEPVATHHSRHLAIAHAERIGGEWTVDLAGFAVYGPATGVEHHEQDRLFNPVPTMRGQIALPTE